MFKLFDAHFHIIDPKFPCIPNNAYLPPPFTVKDYVERTKGLNVKGGAVISGSFQGFDQTYLRAALKKLGPSFVGVTQLPLSVSDEEILSLSLCGVRGVRFNFKRGKLEKIGHLECFAKRVYEIAGWHTELYIDSRELCDLSQTFLKLPLLSIDHLGLSKADFSSLLSLVEKGVKVKATGFGRVDFDPLFALKEIVKINPDALMFGTDLPSTRAPRPFLDEDIRLILDNFDENIATKILWTNAVQFYTRLCQS